MRTTLLLAAVLALALPAQAVTVNLLSGGAYVVANPSAAPAGVGGATASFTGVVGSNLAPVNESTTTNCIAAFGAGCTHALVGGAAGKTTKADATTSCGLFYSVVAAGEACGVYPGKACVDATCPSVLVFPYNLVIVSTGGVVLAYICPIVGVSGLGTPAIPFPCIVAAGNGSSVCTSGGVYAWTGSTYDNPVAIPGCLSATGTENQLCAVTTGTPGAHNVCAGARVESTPGGGCVYVRRALDGPTTETQVVCVAA